MPEQLLVYIQILNKSIILLKLLLEIYLSTSLPNSVTKQHNGFFIVKVMFSSAFS